MGDASSVLQRAIATWMECFETAHGTKPLIPNEKDRALLVSLIHQRGVDEVCELIKGYLETGTRWARDNAAWTIPAFNSQYKKLLAMKADGTL